MQRLILLFLILNSSLVACRSVKRLSVEKGVYSSAYFTNTSVDYVYKSSVEAYGKHFGGILIIKKLKEDGHRVVMTTEFGNRIFDFEISEDHFQKNYMLEALDKKFIVNMLRKDFQLLLKEKFKYTEKYTENRSDLFVSVSGKQIINFTTVDGKLLSLESGKRKKLNTKISFSVSDHQKPEKISIDHEGIPLKIALNLLEY